MRSSNLVAALASTICVVALATPAQAQRRAFDIPAGSLGAALSAFGRQSGRPVIYRADEVRGIHSPGYRGEATAQEALAAILADTGFSVRNDGSGAIAVVRAASAVPASGGPEDEQVEEAGSEAVIVTGSRIRGARTAAPVITVGREESLNAGHNDLGEVIRNIPQNFTGGQNPGVIGGGNQGGLFNLNSSSTLNLRGLGPDASLTLINGHRLPYDALNQGVDISAIPLAAIERIEVVADGASALYGSDAVGGVANVILRRDFDGAAVSGRFGASTDGGNQQQQYNLVAGSRWGSGGFMAAFDYSRQTPIMANQRDYTSILDDTATLVAGYEQYSIVVSGHQQVTDGIVLELDAQFNDRSSLQANPFLITTNVFTNGLRNRPSVQSFTLTPTLRFRLPAAWEATVSGTYGEGETEIRSQRFQNSAETRGFLRYDNRVESVEATAEGPLFRAPGGDTRLAIGAGFRSVTLDVLTTSTPPGGATATTRDLTDGRDIFFGYGELSVPLVGPGNRMPLVERLRFTAAVRYEHYRDIGSVATPKLEFVYEPHRDITLRGTWGRSFKAPTLNQENTIYQGILAPGFIFVPSTLPAGATVLVLGGGPQGPLQPERATTWTATLAVRPTEGLSLEASYFDVNYRDRIASPVVSVTSALGNPIFANQIIFNPTLQQVQAIIAALPQGLANQTGQPFNPASVGAIINSTLQNVARERLHGVDLAMTYRVDLSARDRLNLTASASYLDGTRQLSPAQPTFARAGTIFNPPHWRARGGGTWQRSNLTLSAFVNHIGGVLDNRLPAAVEIGSFTTFDAIARLRSGAASGPFAGLEASLSVTNLFDEQPALIRNTNQADPPYDSTNYPVTGRFISLTLRKSW